MNTTKPIARDERVYANAGNPSLLNLLDGPVRRVLDVGCGAGDNAMLLKQRYPSASISGVTVSAAEAAAARPLLDACWVFDIEQDFPPDLQAARFDTLVFSHVLEHLRNPAEVLAQFVKLLDSGGGGCSSRYRMSSSGASASNSSAAGLNTKVRA